MAAAADVIAHAAELGVQLPQVPRIFDRSPGFAVTSRHEHEHGRRVPSTNPRTQSAANKTAEWP